MTAVPPPTTALTATKENDEKIAEKGAAESTKEGTIEPSGQPESSCQTAKKQLAYLDLRRVEKPEDDPLRDMSRT